MELFAFVMALFLFSVGFLCVQIYVYLSAATFLDLTLLIIILAVLVGTCFFIRRINQFKVESHERLIKREEELEKQVKIIYPGGKD